MSATPPQPTPRTRPDAVAVARWQRLSALLDEALDLPDAAARTDWLADWHQREPELATELARLLAAHGQAEADDRLAHLPSLQAPPAADRGHGLQPGQRVGPWQLVELLGTGGMSVVWLAERADGAYVREVALKLPLHLPWRDDLAARLARERDILARLTHPHIAQLYDAGVTDDGLPWLAMERVRGETLQVWCQQQALGLRERVEVFLQVLDAVAHAHAALVLHRDLKPSNILVTRDGGVKLLDFGIAKLLDEQTRQSEDTQLTRLGGRAMTPDYASPEQIRGEPLTTASDVYSLGVVLYELLCGQQPYRLKHRSAAQLETAVLETQPARPSSRVHESPAVASHLGLTPRRLAGSLRGELDAIVLMALRKQAAARYSGPAAFRADLQAWLDGLPVAARPDSLTTRARRVLRRHWLIASLATVIATLLVGSTVLSIHQSRLAEREAQRARAALDFLQNLYRPVSWLSGNPSRAGEVSARELLDLSAEQLRQQPLADPEVQREVMKLLLGLFRDVDATAQREKMAIDLLAHVRSRMPGDAAAQIEALLLLANARFSHDEAAAAASLEEAGALFDRTPGVPADIEGRLMLARGADSEPRDWAAALKAFERAEALLSGPGMPANLRAEAVAGQARMLTNSGTQLQAARDTYMRLLALMRADPSLSELDLTQHEAGLADVEMRLGHFQAAVDLYRQIHARSRARLGATHVDTLQTGYRLGLALRRTGQPQAALALLQQTREDAMRTPVATQMSTLPSLDVEIAGALGQFGDYPAAASAYGSAVDMLTRRVGQRPDSWRAFWRALAVPVLAQGGQLAQARQWLALATAEAAQVGKARHVERALAEARATLAVAEVRSPAGLAAAQDALQRWREVEDEANREATPVVRLRGEARLALRAAQARLQAGTDLVQASALAAQAHALITPEAAAEIGTVERGEAASMAAELAWRQGQVPQACQWAGEAVAALQAVPPTAPPMALASALHARCQNPGLPPAVPNAAQLVPSMASWGPVWQQRWVALNLGLNLGASPSGR